MQLKIQLFKCHKRECYATFYWQALSSNHQNELARKISISYVYKASLHSFGFSSPECILIAAPFHPEPSLILCSIFSTKESCTEVYFFGKYWLFCVTFLTNWCCVWLTLSSNVNKRINIRFSVCDYCMLMSSLHCCLCVVLAKTLTWRAPCFLS